jgi:hypothetical protein
MAQTSGETLREFVAAVEQLEHQALVLLLVGFTQTEAAHAFIIELRIQEVKQRLQMDGNRTLNVVLNQALKLEAAKTATRLPPRL